MADKFGLDLAGPNVHVAPPLSYTNMVRAVIGAESVVTDSGGLQKESYLLGTVCTTVRTETEWPETLDDGWDQLCFDVDDLPRAVARPRPTGPKEHRTAMAAPRSASWRNSSNTSNETSLGTRVLYRHARVRTEFMYGRPTFATSLSGGAHFAGETQEEMGPTDDGR